MSGFPEVVDLNAGGRHFTTSLFTLTKYPDSTLAAMFMGAHPISKDKEGRYFLDMDSDDFYHILKFLRFKKIPSSDKIESLMQVAKDLGLVALKSLLSNSVPMRIFAAFENVRKGYPTYNTDFQRLRELLSVGKSNKALIMFHCNWFVCDNPHYINTPQPYCKHTQGRPAFDIYLPCPNWLVEFDISSLKISSEQAICLATVFNHDLKQDGVEPLENKPGWMCGCSVFRYVKLTY